MSEATALPQVGDRLPPLEIGPFDAPALARYAEVSGDDNPLHLDDALAQSVGFAAPPVHGMKLLAAFESLLKSWRGDLVIASLGGTFVQPVLRGEKATLTGRVLRVSQEDEVLRASLRARAEPSARDHGGCNAAAARRQGVRP